METNNNEWLKEASPVHKKSKGMYILSLAILLLGLAGTGIYFFALDKNEEIDTPPSLEFEGGQGFIFSGNYLEFKSSDMAEASDKTFGTTVAGGVQALYSNTNTTLKSVLDAIKPDLSLKIMFAYYNEDTKKFDVFPKGPYSNSNLIDGDKLEQYEIPANRGFFLIASKTFEVSSAIKLYTTSPTYLSNAAGAKTYLKNLMNSYPSVGTKTNDKGETVPDYDWRLMAGSPENIIEACGSRVKSIFRSVVPDANGIKFAKFPADSNEGFALWVQFQGDSGSCASNNVDDNGTTICVPGTLTENDSVLCGMSKFTLICDPKNNERIVSIPENKFMICIDNKWTLYDCIEGELKNGNSVICSNSKPRYCNNQYEGSKVSIGSNIFVCNEDKWVKEEPVLDLSSQIDEIDSIITFTDKLISDLNALSLEVDEKYKSLKTDYSSYLSIVPEIKHELKKHLLVSVIDNPTLNDITSPINTNLQNSPINQVLSNPNLQQLDLTVNQLIKNLFNSEIKRKYFTLGLIKARFDKYFDDSKLESSKIKQYKVDLLSSTSLEIASENLKNARFSGKRALANFNSAGEMVESFNSSYNSLLTLIEKEEENNNTNNSSQSNTDKIDEKWHPITKCLYLSNGDMADCESLIDSASDEYNVYSNIFENALDSCSEKASKELIYQCFDLTLLTLKCNTGKATNAPISAEKNSLCIKWDDILLQWKYCSETSNKTKIFGDFYCNGSIWQDVSDDEFLIEEACEAQSLQGAINCFESFDSCHLINDDYDRWDCFGDCDQIDDDEDKNACFYYAGDCDQIDDGDALYFECHQEQSTCDEIDEDETRWECFESCSDIDDIYDLIACHQEQSTCDEIDEDETRWECFDGCENIEDEVDQDNCNLTINNGDCELLNDENEKDMCFWANGDCENISDPEEKENCFYDEGNCGYITDPSKQYECAVENDDCDSIDDQDDKADCFLEIGDCSSLGFDEDSQDECFFEIGDCEDILDPIMQYDCAFENGDCDSIDDQDDKAFCFFEIGDCASLADYDENYQDECYYEYEECDDISDEDMRNKCYESIY
ncbi:MAG: hypothetical protein RBS56_04110 [Candidatus Gracilibacteria bacterium]|nr:hypothetical protein [Candidatus Gracilibacteria bacterium]